MTVLLRLYVILACWTVIPPTLLVAEVLNILDVAPGKLADSVAKYPAHFTSLGLTFLPHDEPIDFSSLRKFTNVWSFGVGDVDEVDLSGFIAYVKSMPCITSLVIYGSHIRILPHAMQELKYVWDIHVNAPLVEDFPAVLLRMPSVRRIAFDGPSFPSLHPDSIYPYVYVKDTTFSPAEGAFLLASFHMIVFSGEDYISLDDSVDRVADVQPAELTDVLSRSERLRQILGSIIACADTLTSTVGRVHSEPKYSLLAFEAGKHFRIRMFDDERIEVDGRILKPSILFRRFEAALELDRYHCAK